MSIWYYEYYIKLVVFCLIFLVVVWCLLPCFGYFDHQSDEEEEEEEDIDRDASWSDEVSWSEEQWW